MKDITAFYDALAGDYHLIFADWEASIERQSVMLDALIRTHMQDQDSPMRVLDCACGIGTQAIGLAKRGYHVHATDISAEAVTRAQRETHKMSAQISFGIADMRTLSQQIEETFDVVIAFDNALPHLLTDDDLSRAAREIFAVTRPDGVFMASIRDYDALLTERPQITSERVIDSADGRRVTFQVWDWEGEYYAVTQFFLLQMDGDWQMRHYTGYYRALKRQTLTDALQSAGFSDIQWPEDSGHYSPVVVARRAN